MIWIRNYFHLLLQTLVACISILFIQYCAVIKVPSGGPKDMTPPYILNVSPSTGSMNYKGEKIVIQFSEYMNPKSIENGIRIFPNIKGAFVHHPGQHFGGTLFCHPVVIDQCSLRVFWLLR